MIHKVLDIIISGEDNVSGVQIYDVLMTPILLDSFCDDMIWNVQLKMNWLIVPQEEKSGQG